MSANDDDTIEIVEEAEVEETEAPEEVEEELEDGQEAEETGSKKDESNVVDRSELNKVIRQRQEVKKKLRDTEKKLAELERANETEAERVRREAAEEAAERVVSRYKPVLVRKTAEGRLLEAGVKPNKINRLIKLMDMEEIDVDEDLNVEGVDDEIDRLQEEFPELFRLKEEEEVEEKPRKRRAPKAEASDRTPPPKKKTTTEILWEGLTKGRH